MFLKYNVPFIFGKHLFDIPWLTIFFSWSHSYMACLAGKAQFIQGREVMMMKAERTQRKLIPINNWFFFK